MAASLPAAQDGFNEFIEKQRALGDECWVTLVQFDDEIETVWPRQLIEDAGTYELEPRRSTSLLDAIGYTLTDLVPLADAQVIVLIVTDGQENTSREFKREIVKEMIETRQADDWSFVFVGAGIDAFAEGGSMGVSPGSTMSMASRSLSSYDASYAAVSDSVTRSRVTETAVSFTDEERERVAKADEE